MGTLDRGRQQGCRYAPVLQCPHQHLRAHSRRVITTLQGQNSGLNSVKGSSPVRLAQRQAIQTPRCSRRLASAATAAPIAPLRRCRQAHARRASQTPVQLERRCQRTNKQRTNKPAAQQVAAAQLPQQPLHPVGLPVGVRRADGRLRPRRRLHMPLAARSIAPHDQYCSTVSPVLQCCWPSTVSVSTLLCQQRWKASGAGLSTVCQERLLGAVRTSLAQSGLWFFCLFWSEAEARSATIRVLGAMSGPRPLRAPSKRDASKLPTSTRGAYLLDAAAAVLGAAPVFASLLARRAVCALPLYATPSCAVHMSLQR